MNDSTVPVANGGASTTASGSPMYTPKPGRLVQAYTPKYYPGHLNGLPPPYINAYENRGAVPSVIITVRGVANKDGTQGPVSCIEISEPDLREFLTYCARWLGWLPITEEQWLRYYELNKPPSKVDRTAPETSTRSADE